MEVYLVGGAVRDELLGYPVNEWDWVVVGATPEDLLSNGYKQVGRDFPVFLHPETKDEYALARTERKTASGYKGFEVHAGKDVTLEQDLERRDLTINAIAKDADGRIIDYYGGVKDLENRLLRHVSPAFAEDPVRILRICRFMARYGSMGFSIASETIELMKQMVENGEVDALVSERVWAEFYKALNEESPWLFIECMRECGALARVMPEIDKMFGVPQREDYHPEVDSGIHALLVLKEAVRISDDPEVRFAALCHDLGKAVTPEDILPQHIGHEERGVDQIKALCSRIHCPNSYRNLAVLASQFHTKAHNAYELKASTVLKMFYSMDAFRKPDRFLQFLNVCEADVKGRKGKEDSLYPQKEYLRKMLDSATNIDTSQLGKIDGGGEKIAERRRELQLNAIKMVIASYKK
ncbi:MAG: multifunctional CCA addition/repair protein [Gammaproteobacteria bacterium]|nr:MAG: multifunctional CCA addition/repair protein [Gammaproteobacteria bacterium]